MKKINKKLSFYELFHSLSLSLFMFYVFVHFVVTYLLNVYDDTLLKNAGLFQPMVGSNMDKPSLGLKMQLKM